MKTITGNILDVKTGTICHQVNCQKAAGAGLALQIRNKWPAWYHEFRSISPFLGETRIFEVAPKLYIANLYTQNNFGVDKRRTNYAALENCLMQLRSIYTDAVSSVYFPHGMGCGLGGGDWSIVSQIIEDALPDAIIVRLPR